MYVRRNYAHSYYRRSRQSKPILILLLGAIIGGILVAVTTQFDLLQAEALEIVGVSQPATPYAGEVAVQGAQKFAAGDLEGARADFERAVQQQPDNIDYLYELGRVYFELARYEDAVPLADHAIQVAPNDVRGYALKANALAWSDPGNAVPIAIQGRNIDPNFSAIYAAQAIAYTNLGRYELAIEAGQNAINADPKDADAYRAYSWPLIYVGQYELAVEQLETAITLAPNLTGPYFQLAFEYKSRFDDATLAIAVYLRILDMKPSPADTAKANLRICEAYAQGNAVGVIEFNIAEPYCEEAIRIKPDYGSGYRQLGMMRYQRRNYEGAIEAFETCVALGATDIQCWSSRGLAHYWLNNCDEAWTVLNEALVRARQQNEAPETITQIEDGLYNIRSKEPAVAAICPAYKNMPQPTAVLPTAIPPTPIGGL